MLLVRRPWQERRSWLFAFSRNALTMVRVALTQSIFLLLRREPVAVDEGTSCLRRPSQHWVAP
jgi:hypothetical protein